MEQFRTYLQQEFLKRTAKNSGYSLRAFAQSLDINHASLSSIMSGKRNITENTVTKLTQALGLGPEEINKFLSKEAEQESRSKSYHYIQQDAFNSISDWYFDAILQLSLIPKIKLDPEVIAMAINIPKIEAKIALETLERLELLKKDKKGSYKRTYKNSTNILDPDFTNAAMKKYQKKILEKSSEALEKISKTERDHTSTTMAIQKKDLSKAKELIKKFRHDLDHYLQRDASRFDEIYQLQVSFFPLTNLINNKSNKNKEE